jgi:hypothetical protein
MRSRVAVQLLPVTPNSVTCTAGSAARDSGRVSVTAYSCAIIHAAAVLLLLLMVMMDTLLLLLLRACRT